MAIVNLTADVITTIVGNARKIYELDRAKIDSKVPTVPDGLGEWLFGLLVPLEAQKQILALQPDWIRATQGSMSLRIRTHDSTNWNHAANPHFLLPPECMALNHATTISGVPGTLTVSWDGYCMSITLAEKTELLSAPDAHKDFLIKLTEVKARHDKLTKASKKAGDTMRMFLEQHRTVQQAMKAFGPAMKAYIDPWLQMELDRVPAKTTRKKKEAKENLEIDVSKLIAKATAKQLNL